MPKSAKRVSAGKKSKRKGSSFELTVAKQLQDWWGEGQFARSPGSGGWGRPQNREGFNAAGDVITTSKTFPWCVECKNQEGWTLDQLLLNEACIIWSWWEQTKSATPAGLHPMLIFKKNRQEALIMTYAGHYTEGNAFNVAINHKYSNGEHEIVMVSRFKDLLSLPVSYFNEMREDMSEEQEKCPKCKQILMKCKCKDTELEK